MVGGIIPLSKEIANLTNEHKAAAASLWPIFDFTEPIFKAVLRSAQKNSSIEVHSTKSPIYNCYQSLSQDMI